ncbi:hypothetical protein [Arthrobacter zhaoguopingii]|uniref:hypothetical protein n=1 Tax=Arthrobacter zhaoguopingii TaxID=2681491 RepID=UPI0013587BA2|nr:hypothetical protein [Arthrobacter zhaoguopingii]
MTYRDLPEFIELGPLTSLGFIRFDPKVVSTLGGSGTGIFDDDSLVEPGTFLDIIAPVVERIENATGRQIRLERLPHPSVKDDPIV